MQLSEGNIERVSQCVDYLPNVRDLCVEQNMTATVSAGVKPELFLRAKKKLYKYCYKKAYLTHPQSNVVPIFMQTSF